NFVILAVPGEFTTMAGRRLRNAVKATLVANGVIGEDGIVVLSGPANEYTHYVTTLKNTLFNALTLLPGVIVDVPPIGKKFGDILQDVDAFYSICHWESEERPFSR
ncbi:1595_t:CDS:2, partial [Paraglomus occultum]